MESESNAIDLTLLDVHVGDWIVFGNPCSRPLMILAIHIDGTLFLGTTADKETCKANIYNGSIHPLIANADVLSHFGFIKLLQSNPHIYTYPNYEKTFYYNLKKKFLRVNEKPFTIDSFQEIQHILERQSIKINFEWKEL